MRNDPHSYADFSQGRVTDLRLALKVDFESQKLVGEASLSLADPGSGPLDLDSRGLSIRAVRDENGSPLPFQVHPADPILGERVTVERDHPVGELTLVYETAPDASALMWLAPPQTDGGKLPFLLTQCQCIHTRSIVPLQDTPSARIRYRAAVEVPRAFSAVMSAAPGERTTMGDDMAKLTFEMPQPIPPYLMALAVGDLAYRDLGDRCRVYAEPGVVEKAAWEFADVEKMLVAAEALFGPYQWDRFDFIVLPPSFPMGGMENPRMTFLTPTLLAGDRSLVGVLAHELAHSWTGNLVTNANNEHFWLNEGWTVYAERRILEALEGPEAAIQGAILGRIALDSDIVERKENGQRTALRYAQDGLDPESEFCRIPYEKGFLLLVAMERAVGRDVFDPFVRAYIEKFQFSSITTDEFVAFAKENLPGAGIDFEQWTTSDDIPADAPKFHSETFDQLGKLAGGWKDGIRPEPDNKWSTQETLYFLNQLGGVSAEDCIDLRDLLKLGPKANAELRCAWLVKACGAGVTGLEAELRSFIGTIGRTKFVKPVIAAMLKSDSLNALGKSLIEENAHRFHVSTRQTLAALL